jgi:hypothetical protein
MRSERNWSALRSRVPPRGASKMARSLLRRIRVRSREERKERILKGVAEMNRAATVMRWKKFDLGVGVIRRM